MPTFDELRDQADAKLVKQERDRAYSIIWGERQKIMHKAEPSAERDRIVRLLGRLADRVKGKRNEPTQQ